MPAEKKPTGGARDKAKVLEGLLEMHVEALVTFMRKLETENATTESIKGAAKDFLVAVGRSEQ